MPARFKAASTLTIRAALSPSAATAVGDWETTPARIVATSGTRVVRPSAEMSRTVPCAGTSGSSVGAFWAEAMAGSSAVAANAVMIRMVILPLLVLSLQRLCRDGEQPRMNAAISLRNHPVRGMRRGRVNRGVERSDLFG